MSVEVSMSALIASAGIPSGPAAFPFFRRLIALLMSLLFGLSQLISRSTSAAGIFGLAGGAGRLRCSWKCSAHLLSWSSEFISKSPSLFLIGPADCWYFPMRFFDVSYSYFMSPLAAALSAYSARPSINLLLSSLILFFTALCASSYFSCAAILPARVRLLFRTPFFSSFLHFL